MKGYRLQIKINYINKLIILIKDCNFQDKNERLQVTTFELLLI